MVTPGCDVLGSGKGNPAGVEMRCWVGAGAPAALLQAA